MEEKGRVSHGRGCDIHDTALRSTGDGKGERVLFLHYPPAYAGQVQEPFLALMHKYRIKRCYYGHIHGTGHKYAIQGNFRGVKLNMIASDYIQFNPVLVR